MMRNPWLGLLVAGPMSAALFRLSDLHVHLGPVSAATLRVASRLANRLKAGTAVPPEQLASAEMILISGPEAGFADLLLLAEACGIDWNGRTAILLDSRRDSSDLERLRTAGAAIGTLDSLTSFPDSHFVADADPQARRQLQRFAAATNSTIFYLDQGRKQVYSAGASFLGGLLAPMAANAVDCLRTAGLSLAEARQIAEREAVQTLRMAIKSGRKGWTGPLADRDAATIGRQWQALRGDSPALSRLFLQAAELAQSLFSEDSRWLNSVADPASPIIGAMNDPRGERLAAAGRLAASLAHDWNNVLTLLSAQAGEIAQALTPDHPAAELTGHLREAIAHAGDSPRRLLDWLREEPARMEDADLNQSITAAAPLLHLALGRGVECVMELGPCLPPIPLDRPLLVNALLNLAANASNVMGGRGRFTIQTSAAAEKIELTVADTGPGMDVATQQRVFEPFFTTRANGGGTGLGMETVRTLAESHNAGIRIDSAPGTGCRITIAFPPAATAGRGGRS